jgi:hypothetical protein
VDKRGFERADDGELDCEGTWCQIFIKVYFQEIEKR